ncbi:MAG: transketolase [Solobacterium sp.]|nr:transketolase [Solobacterium sp.]
MENLKSRCYRLRKDVIEIIMAGKSGHIGGDMSVMEILVSLYFHAMNITPENQNDPDRDLFVLSKGHCVESLYAVLAEKGFFPLEKVLKEYNRFGTQFIGHPNNHLPGIEMNSGSLGHVLPVAIGMALAQKMDGRPSRTYVVMGDGELGEGSVWEGAMSASHNQLDNLCAVIDRNGLQISGTTEEVMHQEKIEDRFAAFGWHTIRLDGNDIDALNQAFDTARAVRGKPTIIIADTVKGKGSPVMENKASWHHHVPSQEEYTQIMADLSQQEVLYGK